MTKKISGSDEASELIPNTHQWEALLAAKRVRWASRLSSLVLALISYIVGGPHWLNGLILGALVVEINLSLLVRVLSRALKWRGRSLWPTIFLFYLTFGTTIVACVLVIRNHWGHPLAFLFGLLSFFIGLILAMISLALKKPKKRAEAEEGS